MALQIKQTALVKSNIVKFIIESYEFNNREQRDVLQLACLDKLLEIAHFSFRYLPLVP
jgi:hypothetical protein